MLLGIPRAAGEANKGENACMGSQNFEGVVWSEPNDCGILGRHECRAVNKSGTTVDPAF